MDFEELFARRASHIKPGLERIRKSYEALNRPAAKIPSVLIGGTNGKGSTSGFIWSLMGLSRKRIALYSSPHLVDFSERFQISHHEVSDERVAEAYRALLKDLPEECNAELSFFELATLLGFRIFAEESAVFQVLEVGLGGRWDATNISDPVASIVVSVSRDHQEFLGSELLGILDEKLAIARAGRPLFWGDQGEIMEKPGYKQAISDHVAATACRLYSRGREFWASSQAIHLRLPETLSLDLSLSGIFSDIPDYLKNNLALAAAFYHWYSTSHPEYPALAEIWSEFCEGQSRAPVTLVGRAQRLSWGEVPPRKFLVDVCHNPDGARAFAAAVKRLYPNQQLPALVSILKDKESAKILDILRSVLSPVILFGIDSDRSWDLASLALRHRDLPFYASLEAAFASESFRTKMDEPWAVCGSVAAVGHALKTMKVSPKELSLASIISGDWSFHTDKS